MDWKGATGNYTVLDIVREGRKKGEQGSAHRVGDDGKYRNRRW